MSLRAIPLTFLWLMCAGCTQSPLQSSESLLSDHLTAVADELGQLDRAIQGFPGETYLKMTFNRPGEDWEMVDSVIMTAEEALEFVRMHDPPIPSPRVAENYLYTEAVDSVAKTITLELGEGKRAHQGISKVAYTVAPQSNTLTAVEVVRSRRALFFTEESTWRADMSHGPGRNYFVYNATIKWPFKSEQEWKTIVSAN